MWMLSKTVKPERLRRLLLKEVEKSRFTLRADLEHLGKQPGVKVTEVRLRNAKDFCGQHPGPCVALFPRPHRRHKFLEGLDWVGFNQMFNNLMDRKKIDCDFFSYNREMRGGGRYYIRKGTLRRLKYPFETVNGIFHLWLPGTFEEDFIDCCGKPPPAIPWYVEDAGTPGYACYTLKDEARLRKEEEALT
jgi:hypothetical protein